MRYVKYLLLTVVILLSSVCFSQTIDYEPVGISDKPLPHISIMVKTENDCVYDSYKERGAQRVSIFYVDNKDFQDLKNFIVSNNTNNNYSQTHDYGYGTYKVTYSDELTTFQYIVTPHELSSAFFQRQINFVTSNSYLHEELKELTGWLD